MKKIFFIILVLVFSLLCNAQMPGVYPMLSNQSQVSKSDSIDEAKLHVQYHVTYRETMEDGQMREDLHVLDVGSKVVKYNGEGKYKSTICTILRHYPNTNGQSCYKKLEIDGMTAHVQGTRFVYEEEIPQLEWQLTDGDTVICDYSCQRATTTLRGRKWEVWYTTDIPIAEGPWKLTGLPGLILKAKDADGHFCFSAVEILQPKEKVVSKPEKENLYLKVSPKRLEEMTVSYYKNPEGYVRMAYGEKMMKTMEMIGMKAPSTSRTPCLIERYE